MELSGNFEQVFIKDEKELKKYRLNTEDLRTIKSRQNLIRHAFSSCGGPSLFQWSYRNQAKFLVFFYYAYGREVASRVQLFPPKQLQSFTFTEDLLTDFTKDLFLYFPDLFDIEIIFPRPKLIDNFNVFGQEIREVYYLEPSGRISEARSLYLNRLSVFSKTIAVVFEKVLVLVESDESGREIISSNFLSSGSHPRSSEARYLLSYLDLLDEQGRLKDKLTYNDRREATVAYLPVLIEARKQLEEYFRSERKDFDLPLRLSQGSDFQNAVWKALLEIPYGGAISYGDLAKIVVPPQKKPENYARACGRALNSNPLPIFVPCHRVIGSTGDLVGFAGGVEIKEKLLNLEILHYNSNKKHR